MLMMHTQSSTTRAALCLGILGALLMYLGDMLLYGNWTNTDSSRESIVMVMHGMGLSRLMLGGGLGPLAAIFYGIGFFGVGQLIDENHGKLRTAIVLLFWLGLAYGGAYHSHFPHLAFTFGAGNPAGIQASDEYIHYLTMAAMLPTALASTLFLYIVLRDGCRCHKWLALFSPLPLVLLGWPLQKLPAPWLTLIAGGWNNLIFVIFFIACLQCTKNLHE